MIDTGADVTTLPRYAITWLGIDRAKLKQVKIQGVGGIVVDGWETLISIRIGKYYHIVRALITNDNKTPFLLGRADLLDSKISLSFDSRKKKIIFEIIK